MGGNFLRLGERPLYALSWVNRYSETYSIQFSSVGESLALLLRLRRGCEAGNFIGLLVRFRQLHALVQYQDLRAQRLAWPLAQTRLPYAAETASRYVIAWQRGRACQFELAFKGMAGVASRGIQDNYEAVSEAKQLASVEVLQNGGKVL